MFALIVGVSFLNERGAIWTLGMGIEAEFFLSDYSVRVSTHLLSRE